MQSRLLEVEISRGWAVARCARAAFLLAAVVIGSFLASHGATAGAGGGSASAAAAVGTAGTNACSSSTGKALYDCLAGVLDQMSSTAYSSPETQRALQAGAAQLRAAANKSQALSAIAACRSALNGLIQRARSAGGDSAGLGAIAGVLATAARLIQSKG